MMHALRFFVCTSVFFTALILTGCGSSYNINGGLAQGAAPIIAAVALQVNGVAPNRKQEVQFSEAMDPATINAQSFQVADSSGNLMPGAVTYEADSNIASFLPDPALATGATYTATITTAVTSAGGVHLAKAYSYTFTTRATTDTSPISVNSVSPAANATCVSTTTLITVTFDETPDAATVTPANFVVTGPGGAIPVKLSTNVTTTQVVLTPISPMPSGTINVIINNVGDLADVKMTAPYTWSFSTACSGSGGTGNGATMQYEAPLLDTFTGLSGIFGQITMDASGNTTVHVTGATASTTYTVQFCPAFDSSSTYTPLPCLDVTQVSTDASGNASSTVKFPQPGDWAGDFYLNDPSGNPIFQTYLVPTLSNETYMATLLPDTKTNSGVVTTNSPQGPLSSGTVTFSNGTLQFTVKGASPSTEFGTNSSETVYIDSSGTYLLSTFSTDASGDGSSSFTWGNSSPGGDLFQVEPQSAAGPAGYIGGFSVPD